jgi:hypothetical protein
VVFERRGFLGDWILDFSHLAAAVKIAIVAPAKIAIFTLA